MGSEKDVMWFQVIIQFISIFIYIQFINILIFITIIIIDIYIFFIILIFIIVVVFGGTDDNRTKRYRARSCPESL